MDWQPIETFPFPPVNGYYSDPVLVWDGHRATLAHYEPDRDTATSKGGALWYDYQQPEHSQSGIKPTHWMPLPKAPTP
jgi:hypothetical protein